MMHAITKDVAPFNHH